MDAAPSKKKTVRPGLTPRIVWILSRHFRRRFTARDVVELGESGLLRIPGLEPAEILKALCWAQAKVRREPKAAPPLEVRFEAIVKKARAASDPATEMEKVARVLWSHLSLPDALRALEQA